MHDSRDFESDRRHVRQPIWILLTCWNQQFHRKSSLESFQWNVPEGGKQGSRRGVQQSVRVVIPIGSDGRKYLARQWSFRNVSATQDIDAIVVLKTENLNSYFLIRLSFVFFDIGTPLDPITLKSRINRPPTMDTIPTRACAMPLIQPERHEGFLGPLSTTSIMAMPLLAITAPETYSTTDITAPKITN